MKQISKLAILMLTLLLPSTALAYDFEVDGIYYNIINGTNEASVTSSPPSDAYSDSVNIPSTVTYDGKNYTVTAIGNSAFKGCWYVTSVNIPNSITSIGDSTFYCCYSLTSVNIPNSVTTIGNSAFDSCMHLTSVNIPNSVTSIRNNTFFCCIRLTSVIIPNSVTSIGIGAFLGCSALKNIDIPNSVTSIRREAFHSCNSLTSISIPNSVTSIGERSFYGCSGLTSISISNSVTSIGERSFYGCSGLTNITVACDNTTYDSRNDCNAIIETASNKLIQGCNNTIIPNSVTTIGYGAFSGCSGLTSINIPNSVTTIGSGAFSGCSGLTSVDIPNAVTSISERSFYGCSGLISITIPNSVTTINSSAFEGCSQLTTVILPNTLQILKSKAFNNCNALNTVYSYATAPPAMESSDCFTTYNTATLFVPHPSLNNYKNTNYWNNFYQIYGIDADGNILVDGISLNASNKSLNVNQTFKLVASITPDCATNKAITWSSSNPAVATVDNDGLVTALAAGTATITVSTIDGSNLSASCNVTVSIIPVTLISLNKSSLKLDPDETYQLTATIKPTNATYQTVAWTSSNPNVATVSSSGLVTPVAPGNATITATTTDGTNLSASCQVTVIREVKSITLNASSLSLILPETAQLTATITPSDATYPTLNWTSSNNSVATVDGNGLITSKSVGTTTIKATTTDGTNLSASCQVTVSKQYVTSITLNETNLVMHIGETVQLIADVQPENASNPTVNWSSGNTSVARVDNNGLVTAVAGGTTYIRASAADGSNRYATCAIEVLYDYYLKLDTLSHIRGTAAQVVDLPVTLVNKNPISGIQFDVSLPDGVTFNLVDGLPDVWLDDARGTRSHSISASQLSNGKYRVLVTSSTSKNLKGNDGVLVHMNMLLPQLHNTGNSYINISNIIASEADETRHTLNNTSSKVSMYYIVGDADANASVDIADHAATASKILGKSPSPFYYDAANVDANYSLDVVDLVGITNIALEIKPITIRQVPRSGHLENRLYCDKLRLNESGEAIITLGADCDFDFAGFQMDVSLPPGLTLVEATLNDEASKLGLATETLPESGVTRLLATSFSDVDVSGACPRLLTLKVKAERDYISSGSANIGFDNIIFAERNLTSHYFDAESIEYIEPSGVHELMDKATIYVKDGNIVVDTPVAGMVQIVATDGRMVEHTAHIGHNVYAFEGSGIYIVNFNGKTIKVKL